MQKHICSLQISRICGAQVLQAEHLEAVYMAFSLHYELGKTAFGANLLPTDMGPSDSYALLAGEVSVYVNIHFALNSKYLFHSFFSFYFVSFQCM